MSTAPPASDATVQPLVFGPAERLLFGIFHRPASGIPAAAGVVLCNPFGQESIRAHRLLRVLAARLATAGHPVLRFDYHGTGDSMGDDDAGDLDGWANDLRQADQALRQASGTAQTVWIGMRLGGSIALRAAASAPTGLTRLILWDPILDGTRYLQHLRERHVASLEKAFSLLPVPAPCDVAADPDRYLDEAIGFGLSPLLRQQVSALRPSTHRWPASPDSIVVLCDPDDADGRDAAASCTNASRQVERIELRHGLDWTMDTAQNRALVPAPALMMLMDCARAGA